MINIKSNATVHIECGHCEYVQEISLSDFEHQDTQSYPKPNGMGHESQYTYGYDCTCPNCDEEISAEIEIWEYPEGTLETVNKSSDIQESEEKIQSNIEIPPME